MSALTRWERGAYALSALLGLLASVLLPLVRAVDPRLAVVINHVGDSRIATGAAVSGPTGEVANVEDPWGHPWRRSEPRGLYSVGPDGIDEGGGDGDDITSLWAYAHPVATWTPKRVLRWPRLTLAFAGLALALWTLIGREMLRAPPARLRVEVLRAALLAAAPIGGVLWVVSGMSRLEARLAESGAGRFVQLPASIAIPLSWALLCYLSALAWRLTRPRQAPLT